MNQKQLTKIKIDYYNSEIIIKILREIYFEEEKLYREVAVLAKPNKNFPYKISFRGVTFTTTFYFIKTFFGTFANNITLDNSNFYVSKARIKRLPKFTFDLRKRSKETAIFYKTKYKDYIKYYDIFLDFDIDNLEDIPELLRELEKLIKILIRFNVKFEIVFSGTRGFKVLLWNDIFTFDEVGRIIKNMYNKYKFKFIDKSSMFQIPSKLMKLNFSLAYSNYPKIVFPLKEYNYRAFFLSCKKLLNFDIFCYDNYSVSSLSRKYTYDSFFSNNYEDTGIFDFVTVEELLK